MENKLSKILDILEKLISFDTTSYKSNLELINYIDDYLKNLGIKTKIIYDQTRQKANLFATFGPEIEGGYVLSGHSDVVPVKDQKWHSDPFKLIQKKGKLYGRGTSDMKSFLAIALAFSEDFISAKLKKPIHFAFSYDEEVGCIGVQGLIDELGDKLPKPAYVIVGEPTNMSLVTAHKGIESYEAEFFGHSAHSSQPHIGANAINYAVKLVNFIEEIKAELQAKHNCNPKFAPAFSTINIGKIKGGTETNIIPSYCKLEWDFRPLPNIDSEEISNKIALYAKSSLLPKMKGISNECDIVIRKTNEVKAFQNNADSFFESLILKSAKRNNIETASYCTEAGLFQNADIETIICGPGSIAQAHKPDEYIEISQIEKGRDFMKEFLKLISN